jgi:hypothetical protein
MLASLLSPLRWVSTAWFRRRPKEEEGDEGAESVGGGKRKVRKANSLRGNFVTKYEKPIEEDYEIDSSRLLGKGAYGSVVVGRNKVNSRAYAIKFIQKVGQLTRIEREIKLLTDIDHTNVARLFAIYDSDTQVRRFPNELNCFIN